MEGTINNLMEKYKVSSMNDLLIEVVLAKDYNRKDRVTIISSYLIS